MDTKEIGTFLKQLRKENNMTQEQLGEMLGVTNKTVSRWETGSYMPPIEILKLLSELYQISINEILAGKRLESDDYKNAAEENITAALEENRVNEKRFENNMFIIMGVTTVLAMAIMLLLPDGSGLTAEDRIKEIIVIVLVLAMAFIANMLNIVAVVLKKDR